MCCSVIGLSGKGGGELNSCCDLNIIIPSSNTPRIQEMHLIIEHMICDMIEREFA